jgi:hypothetical protein
MAYHPVLAFFWHREKHNLLAATEPARDAALGLGSALLDLAVELVDGLESLSLGVLCVGLGVALGAASLLVDLGPLDNRVLVNVSRGLRRKYRADGDDDDEAGRFGVSSDVMSRSQGCRSCSSWWPHSSSFNPEFHGRKRRDIAMPSTERWLGKIWENQRGEGERRTALSSFLPASLP